MTKYKQLINRLAKIDSRAASSQAEPHICVRDQRNGDLDNWTCPTCEEYKARGWGELIRVVEIRHVEDRRHD